MSDDEPFSERYNLTETRAIQINSLDDETRARLLVRYYHILYFFIHMM